MCMHDGIIFVGDNNAKRIGFTSDKFCIGSFLFKVREYIYISVIKVQQENQGHFSELLRNIYQLKFGVKVPTPSEKMKKILKSKGFKKLHEYSKIYDDMVEVWMKSRYEGLREVKNAKKNIKI